MRHSLVFLLVPAIVSAQTINKPGPLKPQLGGRCCSINGVADPTETCTKQGLNSFCCTGILSFTGNGCDNVSGTVGRNVQDFPPASDACGDFQFIGCA
ncbi:hypothetical protein CGRA01v4_14028 [Colletotrichum graminicola]|uniref:Hydrophobin n=1 Tax=Colletotrichum graminicola (strain M1.001 / M2 / FGSC 10212) TaxID=645133 RepID=E3QYG1_COLGM|nr:uncharacterized protein GLRG_11090 [Colletotrichum graminicola M1.001]EFQ35899.1 hypothetical protein GLRG_11090 [Colletotrichum graminicola M1.001]WDK22738.1 hypothetical protein CGRA01v4_14028 [Colletotrichum graminicola]